MSQIKILVDTNSYLRLAKTIRPLLFQPFGEKGYCLYILPELNEELEGRRLQSKFPWVEDEEYLENRKHFPNIGRKQKKSIKHNFEFVWDYVQTEFPGPSRIDVWYIAYALELSVPIVTDDQDMAELAKTFDTQVLSTLELLKIMFDSGHTSLATINGLCDYWRYISDMPSNFQSDYQRFFGES